MRRNRNRGSRIKSRQMKNTAGILLISFVVLMVFITIVINNTNLKRKKDKLDKQEAYYIERIEEQNLRAGEIEDYRKYMQTKQYIEDMAKDKLGLVYPDEIIFEAEN